MYWYAFRSRRGALLMTLWWWCCVVVCALFIVSVVGAAGGGGGGRNKNAQYMRKIRLVNESPSDIEIYWVNPTTLEKSHFASMAVGDSFPIDTFVGHEFRLEEVGTSGTNDKLSCLKAPKRRCRNVSYVVGDDAEEKLIRINGEFETREEVVTMSSPDSDHLNDGSMINPKKKFRSTGGSKKTASRGIKGATGRVTQEEDYVDEEDALLDDDYEDEEEEDDTTAAHNYSREKLNLVVWNDSPSRVEVYWFESSSSTKPNSDAKVLISKPGGVAATANFQLGSYEGHVFELVEVPHMVSNVCTESPTGSCRATRFVVSARLDHEVIRVGTNFDVDFMTSADMNRRKARRNLNSGSVNSDGGDDAPPVPLHSAEDIGSFVAKCKALAERNGDEAVGLMECVERGLAGRLELYNEEISFQATVRTGIASKLENYTCLDDTLDSSPDVETRTWRNPRELSEMPEPRTVHVKHRRPSSQIHVIENFIRTDECKAMEEAAIPDLHQASVADGKGGSRVSESRKAMQAGITVPWDKEADDHPIARLSRRVYDYTNHVLGLNIQEFGQEDLMSIQYFGRGRNDTAPDRYTPHCDGACTGLPHQHATRMATMVMYCDVAEAGGHTNFRNAGVHVKPETGNAIFFSYIDPKTKIMDTGFTEHSGCPVFRGEKKIVTQWIRLGVDSENPWNSFNTLGIKHSTMRALERGEEVVEEHAEEEVQEEGEERTTEEDAQEEDDDDAIKTTTNHSATTSSTGHDDENSESSEDQFEDFSTLQEAAAAATTTEAEIREEL